MNKLLILLDGRIRQKIKANRPTHALIDDQAKLLERREELKAEVAMKEATLKVTIKAPPLSSNRIAVLVFNFLRY